MKKQVNNMNERELDQAKVETYKRVVEFARDAVEKQRGILIGKISETENALNNLLSIGANFNKYEVRKTEENIRKNQSLLEKVERDLDYLNDIIQRIRDVMNCIDPIKKRLELEKLNKLIEDINFVHDASSENTRLREIEREIENVKNTYNQRIMNEGDSIKRRDLGSERDQRINNLNDRASRLNRYVALNPSDRTSLIDSINNEITALNSKTAKTYEEQLQDTILIVKPLFKNYENNYGGQDVTVKEYGGESMFKYIMKSTDTYAKLGLKVDKLEQSLNAVNSNRLSKDKPIYDTHQHSKLLIRTPNQTLPYRLREMKQKQISIKNEQKIVMLRREQIIENKNRKISKLEARSEQLREEANRRTARNVVTKKFESANIIRKKFNAWVTDVRINFLKKKPIFLANRHLILLKEEFKDSILRKSTDKNGNIDYRPWQERALERMEEKNEKKWKRF